MVLMMTIGVLLYCEWGRGWGSINWRVTGSGYNKTAMSAAVLDCCLIEEAINLFSCGCSKYRGGEGEREIENCDL